MSFYFFPEVQPIYDESFADLVFLFNPRQNSWVAITSQAYKYLEVLLKNENDPLSLGLSMGFSQEEITQFFAYLLDRNILTTSQQFAEENTCTLRSCYLHVTQTCNLRCSTCYSWRENRNNKQGELSLEQIEQVLAQLASLQLQTLVISGGEPLTRNDLPLILRLAKEKYNIPKIILITNGSLVTYEWANAIAPWVDEVTVSLDGTTEEINSQIRGKGNFRKALSGLQIFKASSVKSVKLVATITHVNVQYLHDFQKLAQKVGVEVSFSIFVGLGAGELPEAQTLALTTKDLQYLGQALMEMGGVGIDFDGVKLGQPNENTSEPLYLALEARVGCGVGCEMLSIDHDGGVYPCHMLMKPELLMGNVSQNPLTEILAESPLSQSFHNLNVGQIETCKGCTLRYFCGGGCRAASYSAHRNFQSHDPSCTLYRTYLYAALAPLMENPTSESSKNSQS